MVQYDAHMHTQFSTDSEELMENMIRESIRRKLCGITFTDHMDYRFPVTYDWELGKGENRSSLILRNIGKPLLFCVKNIKSRLKFIPVWKLD